MLDFLRRKFQKRVPLEEQLKILADCGIRLLPGISPEQILNAVSRKRIELEPFLALLCEMGQYDRDNGAYGTFSNDIWHFDIECIEDHGDYKRIAERMSSLTQGALPLENIEDFVDIENETAWISFSLDGESQRWSAKVDNDWADPDILMRFSRLLESRDANRRFTFINLQGQDCLMGCATPEEKDRLEQATGLKVEWLKHEQLA